MTSTEDIRVVPPRAPQGPASVWNAALELQQAWGPPPETVSEELNSHVLELQADLQALVDDIRQGPLGRWRQEAADFLLELRREFLRHHRRLVVQARQNAASENEKTPAAAAEWLRAELAELTERFRSIALSRSSRLTHGAWSPSEIVQAIDRTVAAVPAQIVTDYEASSYLDPAHQSAYRWMGRRLLRLDRWSRRLVGEEFKKRIVPVRALARYHLSKDAAERVEGIAAVFLQAEAQLGVRTRLILDGIVRGYDVLVEHIAADDFPALLARLRLQVEDEFALAEDELGRLVEEGARRTTGLLSESLRALKADLPVIDTLDLPVRKRHERRLIETRDLEVEELQTRLVKARETAAGQYVMLALHLEFVSFRARAKKRLDERLADLARDIRGRSQVQAERVLHVLDEAISVLEGELDGSAAEARVDEDEEASEEALKKCLEPVERVLSEALRSAHQLLDQFTADQSVAPLLEALNREASSLTDRYTVPAGKLPFAEWKLPPALMSVEVAFSDLVSAYIQTDVAPRLLSVASASGEKIRPLLLAFEELERVVTFSAEQFDDEIAYREPATQDLVGRDQIRVVIASSLARSRASLAELAKDSGSWSSEIVDAIRESVLTELSALRDQLGEGEIGSRRPERIGAATHRLDVQLARFGRLIERAGEEGTKTMRRVVGEDRLVDLRDRLGLPAPAQEAPDLALLARPDRNEDVPIYYRRLFSPQAHWAGDVIAARGAAVDRVRRALTGGTHALRTAALVGIEGVGRGAFMGAAARSERWSSVKRVAFTRPATIEDVEAVFGDLSRGSLVVVSGLSWCFSARPGRFEALRRFVDGVVANQGRCAWLLEIDTMVWRYACQCAPLGDVFAEVVRVDPLDAGELAAAILARHHLSGLELKFRPDGTDADHERFFQSLHVASGGLLQVALTAWVAAVERFDEHRGVVTIGVPPPSPMEALRALPRDIQHEVFLIARQGWMDADTLAWLFRIPASAAEGRLSRLVRLGLLERPSGRAYVVRRHLRGAVERMLDEGGWTR